MKFRKGSGRDFDKAGHFSYLLETSPLVLQLLSVFQTFWLRGEKPTASDWPKPWTPHEDAEPPHIRPDRVKSATQAISLCINHTGVSSARRRPPP